MRLLLGNIGFSTASVVTSVAAFNRPGVLFPAVPLVGVDRLHLDSAAAFRAARGPDRHRVDRRRRPSAALGVPSPAVATATAAPSPEAAQPSPERGSLARQAALDGPDAGCPRPMVDAVRSAARFWVPAPLWRVRRAR